MEGWERIQYIIEREGLNKNSFSTAIGLTNNVTITRIINEKRNPSKATCQKIVEQFPIYSLEWLISGEGEPISLDPERKEKKILICPSDIKEGDYSGALVYNIDGTCGAFERDMAFTNDSIIGSVNLPEINKESKIIRANGDSMEPVIFDGDRVVLRQIHNFDEIFYGQIYLILLEEYRMIKYIRRYNLDEENYIILRSRNEAYDDIKLHKSKIKKLFIVENILSVKSQL